jgi:hypothetical protein
VLIKWADTVEWRSKYLVKTKYKDECTILYIDETWVTAVLAE